MEYRHLTDDVKRRELNGEIARFELEHYRHAVALETAEEMDDEQAAATARENMSTLETAIRVRAAALDGLG